MLTLYTIGIFIYHTLIQCASLFGHGKAKSWVQGRKKTTSIKMPTEWADKNRILIHAASFGEYEMAKPIVSQLLEEPHNRLYVSFFSPSGFENITFEDKRIIKLYLPIDRKSKLEGFLDRIQPTKVLFIKYEFWFNLLDLLNQRNIPYYFSSLHINPGSHLLKVPRFKKLLHQATTLFCHNEGSIKILENEGFNNLKLFGDTRINKALENKETKRLGIKWVRDGKTMIFGSLLGSETPLLEQVMNAYPDMNYIIAPHDVDKLSLTEITAKLKVPYTYYTELMDQTCRDQVLVINTYVGGGFGKGPHSIIEPLIYGTPTLIGSNLKQYPMARHLQEKGLLSVISKPDDIGAHIKDLLSEDQKRDKIISYLKTMRVDLEPISKELSS